MKKKGLIISTVVMVVVLIASLTTATYAWFSVNPNAEISNITVETKASEGLEIAAYHIADGAISLYSGNVTLQGESTEQDPRPRYWGAETAGDYGASISMAASADATENTPLISNIYATSGDGSKLFVNTATLQALNSQAKPDNIAEAVENTNYFALDFTLRASNKGTIFVKQLSVTPTGSGVKQNMAGALRVALFATTPNVAAISAAPTWSHTTNGKFLYDPYGNKYYAGGSWTNDTNPGKVYATGAGAYADNKSTKPLSHTDVWGTKYIVGQGIGTSGMAAYNREFSNLANAIGTTGNAAFSISEIEASQMIYLRLVVWYDGEDECCIKSFAGGGANLQINFGLEADNTPAA